MGDQAHMQPNPNFAWVISEEQRIQFQKDFKLVDTDQDDFLTGDQARELFMGSGVPVDDLVHIWRLSDRDGDNQLSEMEFAIARFLIYARLNGQNVNMEKVPDSLIQSILENDPRPEPVKKSGSHSDKKMARQNSSKLPKVHPPPSEKDKEKEEKEREKELAKERAKAAKEAARDKKKTAQVSAKQWAISSGQRKKYKAVFKQHNKNGFINGQQALVLFGASKLPNEMLAQIWALSDMDHDNQLSQQEFFVGLHLISKVREGYDLPETTPAALVASASKRSKSSAKPSKKSSGNLKSSGNQMTPVNPDVASDPSTVHQTPVTEVPHSVSRTDTSPLATINATINTAQPVTGSRMTPVIPEFSIEQELALWDQNSDTVKRARDYQLSLENEVSQISLAIGRLKVLEEGMADRYNYRVEQYKLLEYQKNKFQLILNNIIEQCKGEEEELTELTSELKTLWHEMEEQQKIVADPSYEPQQIKAKRKQISEEFDQVKQLYVQSKDEYDALVKEIELLRAEVAQSSSTEQLQHFNDQFVSMQVTDSDRAKFQGDFDAKQEFDFSDLDQQPAQSGHLDFEHFSFKPSQEHNNMVTFNNNLDMLTPPTLTDMHSEFTEDTESVSQYEDGFDDWMTQTAIAMSLNQPASKDQLQRLDSLKALEQGGAPPEANPFGVTPIKERGRRKSSVGSTTSSASASKKAQKEAEKQKAKAEKEAKKRDKVLQRQNSKKENKKNKGH